jgi:hypothetical protein
VSTSLPNAGGRHTSGRRSATHFSQGADVRIYNSRHPSFLGKDDQLYNNKITHTLRNEEQRCPTQPHHHSSGVAYPITHRLNRTTTHSLLACHSPQKRQSVPPNALSEWYQLTMTNQELIRLTQHILHSIAHTTHTNITQIFKAHKARSHEMMTEQQKNLRELPGPANK